MYTTHLKHFVLLVLMSSVLFTACTEDDGPGGGTSDDPSTSLVDLSPIPFESGDTVVVSFSATEGSSPLNTLRVLANGVELTRDEFLVDDDQPASSVILLFGADKINFTKEIKVLADMAADSTATFSFEVVDEAGNSSTESLTLTAEGPSGTPANIVIDGTPTDDGTNLLIPVLATIGTSNLTTITVLENGVAVDPSRDISIGAMAFWNANPYTLSSGLETGFDDNLIFALPATSDDYTYDIIITDAEGFSDTASFSAEINVGTPVDTNTAILRLRNAGGGQGQGGLNLLTGAETNSDDASAHLIDLGIDTDLPVAQNWLQLIAAGPATSVLRMTTGLSNFDTVENKEDIATFYESGAGTDVTTGTIAKVQVGDEFVLRTSNNENVLIKVTAVNVTDSDNSDNYEFAIKY